MSRAPSSLGTRGGGVLDEPQQICRTTPHTSTQAIFLFTNILEAGKGAVHLQALAECTGALGPDVIVLEAGGGRQPTNQTQTSYASRPEKAKGREKKEIQSRNSLLCI